MNYIAEGKVEGGSAASSEPFTDIPAMSDEDGLVVARGELVYAVLNLYPYNPRTPHGGALPQSLRTRRPHRRESAELMAFTQKAIRVMKSVSRPHGFNVGLNLGHSAGGSLAEHLHMHVVPRWGGGGTPTSSPSSAAPRSSRSCFATPASCWQTSGRLSRERLLPADQGGVCQAEPPGGEGLAAPRSHPPTASPSSVPREPSSRR